MTALRSAALALVLTAAAPAPSDTPAYPRIVAWVHTLRDHRGIACCDVADCRPTQAEIVNGRWSAWIGRAQYGANAPDAWMPVDDAVVQGTTAKGDPPDLHAWACFYAGAVKCFVAPGAG